MIELPSAFPIEDVVHSIQMRICYIETGTVTHRASDAVEFNKSLGKDWPRHGIKIKALDGSQRELIARLEEAIKQLRKSSKWNKCV